MKHNAKILTGQKFGKLSVLSHAGTNSQRQVIWLCSCECGNEKIVSGSNLRRGSTTSCGCVRATNSVRHGMTGTGSWNSWRAMMKRCYQKSHKFYHLYGGAGIIVCDRWHTYENFYEDMGDRPDKMSVDRIDPLKGYHPDNCRWATSIEQTANRKDARLIEIDGDNKTASQWSVVSGTPTQTIEWRYRKGWSSNEAVYGRTA